MCVFDVDFNTSEKVSASGLDLEPTFQFSSSCDVDLVNRLENSVCKHRETWLRHSMPVVCRQECGELSSCTF